MHVHRDISRTLWLGGAKLNLLEFKWLMSCSTVTDLSIPMSESNALRIFTSRPGKVFKTELVRWMENAILNLVFANNKATLLTF